MAGPHFPIIPAEPWLVACAVESAPKGGNPGPCDVPWMRLAFVPGLRAYSLAERVKCERAWSSPGELYVAAGGAEKLFIHGSDSPGMGK